MDGRRCLSRLGSLYQFNSFRTRPIFHLSFRTKNGDRFTTDKFLGVENICSIRFDRSQVTDEVLVISMDRYSICSGFSIEIFNFRDVIFQEESPQGRMYSISYKNAVGHGSFFMRFHNNIPFQFSSIFYVYREFHECVYRLAGKMQDILMSMNQCLLMTEIYSFERYRMFHELHETCN